LLAFILLHVQVPKVHWYTVPLYPPSDTSLMDFSPMVHWKKLEAVLDLKVPELRKDKKEKQQTH
jgi:hypothetical protein